jgi:type I restriction enzyme S subunit
VTPTDFSRNGNRVEIVDSERKITEVGLTSSAATLLPAKTVIMASRATIGAVRIAGTELTTNQGFVSFVCRDAVLHHRFLFYVISGFLGDYFAEIAPGTTFSEISRGKAKIEPIAFPPLPEQERIAAYLDASCAAIDAAVAAKRLQIEILSNLRHSKIYRAVTRGLDDCAAFKESGIDWLGEIPSHWSIRRIKDIAELRSGDAIQSEDIAPAGDYPVYGGNGLRGFTSSFTHDGHLVLIGRQGALCGNINYANGKFWATEHAVVVTPLRICNRLWLGELLRVMDLNQYSNAAAQPGLAVDRIRFLRLPVPSPEEQTSIAHHVKDIILTTDRMSAHLEKQVDTLVAYRKSLIHECVTGQRRSTETATSDMMLP